jgi:hypothetical protein
MTKYTSFEVYVKNVMEKLLEGDDPTLEILRRQYECATVQSAEFTGVGFYISYLVPEYAPRIPEKKSFHIGDLHGEIDGVNDGVGFVLFVKDGVINLLEGYTYGDESWPKEITNYELSFMTGGKRDIEKLKSTWQ